MKYKVYIQGREVAVLEQDHDGNSMLTYHADTAPGDFVSLALPVRSQPYRWNDPLAPAQKAEFALPASASLLDLMSGIGCNKIGRLQVVSPGAAFLQPAPAIDIVALMRGDSLEAALAEQVCQQARVLTRHHLIEGPSPQQPFAALNEHLCMQVASRVMLAARTDISDDGQTLITHRVDVDQQGQPCWGVEDFCVLLGLRPSEKYDASWERMAQAVRDHVGGSRKGEAFRQLATSVLLTYALRNADCHAGKLALRYTSQADPHLSPACGLLSTGVYAGFEDQPPAIGFMGKRTWTPGRNLQKFIAATFGIAPKEQVRMVEALCDAVADVAPQVREAMKTHAAFRDIGQRMLLAWAEGIQGLRDKHVYALGSWEASALT